MGALSPSGWCQAKRMTKLVLSRLIKLDAILIERYIVTVNRIQMNSTYLEFSDKLLCLSSAD